MKLNPFSPKSTLFSFRWLIVMGLLVAGLMAWYDLTGARMFSLSRQQQWNSSGPGYHK